MVSVIPFPNPAEVPGLAQLYDEIAARKRHNANRPNREVSNMGKSLGHSPDALRVHQDLTTFVLDKSVIPVELRMLATLRAAAPPCP